MHRDNTTQALMSTTGQRINLVSGAENHLYYSRNPVENLVKDISQLYFAYRYFKFSMSSFYDLNTS